MKRILLVFVILCINFTSHAQFYEDFENTTGPDAVPSTNWTLGSGNWSVFNNPASASIRWGTNSTVVTPPQVYQGINAAYCNRSSTFPDGTIEKYLVTPLVTIPIDGKLRFQTRTFISGIQGTIYQIQVALPTSNPTNPNGYMLIQQWTDETLMTGNYNVYEQKTVDLPSFFYGQQVYIAFVMKQEPITAPFGDRWFIDNVSILSGSSCSFNNNCPQSFQLIAFLDSNQNGIKDVNEPIFNHGNFVYQINNNGINNYVYNNNGTYQIFVDNPNDSFSFNYVVNNSLVPYYISNTQYNNITILPNSGVNTLYFPVQNPNPFVDAKIDLIPLNILKPNSFYPIKFKYQNLGTQIMDVGIITFTKDSKLSPIYAVINFVTYPEGIVPNPDGFEYTFYNLGPNETREFTILFNVPNIPTVQIGELLSNSANIIANNDINLTNNTFTITEAVSSSFDPNDITESHGRNIVFDDFTSNDYLTYTIRFENTGNANAEFIRIENALDSQLDENSFELLSASHDVNVRRNGTQLTFHFYNIDLPPSIPDTETGHGYVQYKIKPKPGYAVGDIIPNTASIFFDYNPPIVTNTFETEFVQSLNTHSFSKDNVVIYPNPANDYLQVALNTSNESIRSVTLTDILGKTILEQKNINSSQAIINTSSLAKGMYLLKITSGTNVSLVKKIVKQ